MPCHTMPCHAMLGCDYSDDASRRNANRLNRRRFVKLSMFTVFIMYPSISSTVLAMLDCTVSRWHIIMSCHAMSCGLLPPALSSCDIMSCHVVMWWCFICMMLSDRWGYLLCDCWFHITLSWFAMEFYAWLWSIRVSIISIWRPSGYCMYVILF